MKRATCFPKQPISWLNASTKLPWNPNGILKKWGLRVEKKIVENALKIIAIVVRGKNSSIVDIDKIRFHLTVKQKEIYCERNEASDETTIHIRCIVATSAKSSLIRFKWVFLPVYFVCLRLRRICSAICFSVQIRSLSSFVSDEQKYKALFVISRWFVSRIRVLGVSVHWNVSFVCACVCKNAHEACHKFDVTCRLLNIVCLYFAYVVFV